MSAKHYTDDGSVCLTDVRRGLITAVLKVRAERARVAPPYTPIPKRHTRLIAARENALAPLRRLEDALLAEVARLAPNQSDKGHST